MEQAIEKINAEMQKDPNNKYIEAIGHYIIDRCSEKDVAEKVCAEDKTLSGCLDNIKGEAKKQAKNGCAVMADSEVFNLVDKYFGFGEHSAEKPAKVNIDLNSFFS